MKNKFHPVLIIIPVVLIINYSCFAQAPEIEWQNTIGGTDYDYLKNIQQTNDGGYILGGYSYSGMSGDKTENNIGLGDYWVVKLNSSGNIQWQNTIGGSDNDQLNSIVQTTDGGYILGGYSKSGISGDKTESHFGTTYPYDYWVVKLDASGTIDWQNTIGGTNDDFLNIVQQTTDGGYILGGTSSSGISGDKTEATVGVGSSDFWVVKLGSNGSIQWQNTIGGGSTEYLGSLQQTLDGGYILGGHSYSGISGDKTEDNFSDPFFTADYWVVKLNSSGAIEWDNTIGGNNNDYLRSIEQTDDEGYILGGNSHSSISTDKTETNLGQADYWVVKLNSSGGILWQTTLGGSSGDYLESVQQTANGEYLVGGYSESGISADKAEASLGDTDYWLVKLSPGGGIKWENTIGGDDTERLYGIQQTFDGGYIVGGYSNSALSGDKIEPCIGYYDYWVMKIYPENASCELTSLINPAGPTQFCQGGNVILKAPLKPGYTYQWKKNGSEIIGSTNSSFNANKTGNYQVEIAEESCSDISDSLLVTVYPKTNAVITNLDATNDVCIDPSIKLKATSGAGYTYQWLKGSAQITGATSPLYYATSAGNYKVNITNSFGCSKSSPPYSTINTCKLYSEEDISEILIYPNPATTKVIIEFNPQIDEEKSLPEIWRIELLDVLGRSIQNNVVSKNKVELDIKDLPSGIYFVKLNSNNENWLKKLIKKIFEFKFHLPNNVLPN